MKGNYDPTNNVYLETYIYSTAHCIFVWFMIFMASLYLRGSQSVRTSWSVRNWLLLNSRFLRKINRSASSLQSAHTAKFIARWSVSPCLCTYNEGEAKWAGNFLYTLYLNENAFSYYIGANNYQLRFPKIVAKIVEDFQCKTIFVSIYFSGLNVYVGKRIQSTTGVRWASILWRFDAIWRNIFLCKLRL